jgi:prephenate dehydratase
MTYSTPVAKTISYQGEPGSNSHMVCEEHYPELEPVPRETFEDVFVAVRDGAADLAMIPIDNSSAGRVADIHYLLPDSGLHIVAEHFLRIRFSLLGVPGATLEGITVVRSHAHALGQCRRLIRDRGLRAVVTADTAGAAREVAEAGDPSPMASRTPTTTRPGSWSCPATSSRLPRVRARP